MYSMAINLLNNSMNSIQGNQAQTTTGAQIQTGQAGSLMRQAAMSMLQELRDLLPGDTLSGQLVSKDGSTIQLLLSNNTLLNTTLDQDVNIGLGQQISFEVKNNQNGQLTLRPMFTNLSNSTTIMSALDAAGIPAGDDTIAMVDSLMKNSMPINREMLTTINHEMNMYPEADVADIVMLHKMDIPVNDANIRQMELYRGNNQWMLENVDTASEQLTDLIMEAYSGDAKTGQAIIEGLKEILIPSSENPDTESGHINPDNPVQNASVEEKDSGIIANNSKTADNNAAIQDATTQDKVVETKEGVTWKGETLDINKFNLFDKVANLDKEILELPEVRKMVNKAVNELLKDNFLMNPQDISEEKFVKKYYEKTVDMAEQLSRLLSENGKADTDFAKTVTNIKENTNFMNQINELYNYVQLPLKMNDSQANGDLYVYARKKGRGLGGEDGNLTALLHLSMEHLGNMDIFLTLKDGQNLSTKFTLEKDEMIDFIESHIDELNNRLIKKGYNIGTTHVGKKEDSSENVIDNIVRGDGSNILLSTQSFDARA